MLAQDREKWRILVNAVLNIGLSIKCEEFLDKIETGYILRKYSVPWR